MSSNSISDLFVTISARTDGFTKGIDGVMDKVNQLSKYSAIAGVAIVGAISAATMKFASTADEIQEMSQRTGIGTTALQEFGYAAKLSGTSLEGMETGIKKMQVNIDRLGNTGVDNSEKIALLKDELASIKFKDDGKTTNKAIESITNEIAKLEKEAATIPDAFKRLNLQFKDLEKLSAEDQFVKITSALADIEDPGTRAALAVELFGRAGTNLLPMLANGAQGLADMRQEAHNFNLIIGEETVAKGAALQDSLDKLKGSFEALTIKIGSSTAFQGLIDKITTIVTKVIEWTDSNPKAVASMLEYATAVVAISAALKVASISMAIFQALGGPKGWASLAIGAVAAAAAIRGIYFALEQIDALPMGVDPRGTPVYGPNGEITGYSKLAAGGIVSSPTLAMIGEAGPEAVIPLGQLSQGNNEIHTHLYLDGEQIAEVVDKRLFDRINSLGVKGYV